MAKKMTKTEMFTQIMSKYALTDEEKAFIEHEIELLAKKNATKSTKPTKTQVANEGYKDTIVEVLSTTADKMEIAEIRKAHPELAEFSSPKFAALLTQLAKEGRVERIAEGRKVYWRAL